MRREHIFPEKVRIMIISGSSQMRKKTGHIMENTMAGGGMILCQN